MDADDLKKQGREMADKLRDGAGEQVAKNEKQIKSTLGKLISFVNAKTGGKYADQVSKAAGYVEQGVDALATGHRPTDAPGTTDTPGAAAPGATGAPDAAGPSAAGADSPPAPTPQPPSAPQSAAPTGQSAPADESSLPPRYQPPGSASTPESAEEPPADDLPPKYQPPTG